MLNNAQLDNEKMTLRYQIESFKDKLDDLEEAQQELHKDHRKVSQVYCQITPLFTKIIAI